MRDWVNCQYAKLEKDVIICDYFDERCDSVMNCIQEEGFENDDERICIESDALYLRG
jgi:hypothetical protein